MTTTEQVAAVPTQATTQHNSDTELAIAHGKALKEEVDKYAARFSVVASNAAANTRKLLELIREALPESSRSVLETLFKELDQLYAAFNDAKAALPIFLEKQRSNTSLYHASMMNQMMQDTQYELNIQHKKVSCPLKHSHVHDAC